MYPALSVPVSSLEIKYTIYTHATIFNSSCNHNTFVQYLKTEGSYSHLCALLLLEICGLRNKNWLHRGLI